MTSIHCGNTLVTVMGCPSVAAFAFEPPGHREKARPSFLVFPKRKSICALLSSAEVGAGGSSAQGNVIGSQLCCHRRNLRRDPKSVASLPLHRITQILSRNCISCLFRLRSLPT